jgi:hypothetical protein
MSMDWSRACLHHWMRDALHALTVRCPGANLARPEGLAFASSDGLRPHVVYQILHILMQGTIDKVSVLLFECLQMFTRRPGHHWRSFQRCLMCLNWV